MRPFHIGDKYSFTEKKVHNSPYPIKLIMIRLMQQLIFLSVCCEIYKDSVR